MTTETKIEITAEEWKRRYAARLMDRGGMSEKPAIECADDSYTMALEDADPDGSHIGPEDAADEEMAQWEDDGAGE